MDELTGLKKKDLPACMLCGFVSVKLINGLCEQCYIGEADDPYYGE